MFDNLDVLRMAHSMAAHAGRRQAVVAENVANADTPGYRARDLQPFADLYDDAGLSLRTTRPGHVTPEPADFAPEVDGKGRQKPNGNTVSLEGEMVKAGEIRDQHDMALAIYRTSLNILRMSVGRG